MLFTTRSRQGLKAVLHFLLMAIRITFRELFKIIFMAKEKQVITADVIEKVEEKQEVEKVDKSVPGWSNTLPGSPQAKPVKKTD